MVKVKVPATTANMGPGFDTFGMALKLYNEIEVEEIEAGVEMLQNGQEFAIPLEDNLIYHSIVKAFKKGEYKYGGLKINVSSCEVPMSRGLGSSATCIVGGIMAANAIMGNLLSQKDIINLATEIEGHPDNVVPAIVGGMAVSINEKEGVFYSKIRIPENLRFAVIIPDFEVNTASARKVLPDSFSRKDCVFNVSHAAMLISAFYNGELDKIRVALQDKIHEPYRKELIANIDLVFEKAEKLGSLGEFISGSGSTLIAIVEKDNINFISAMGEYLKELNWKIILLEPDLKGAVNIN